MAKKSHSESSDLDQATDYKLLYQRALADSENMRKRFDDERKLIAKLAVGDLVVQLLPVLDNFRRATEHVPVEQQETPWMSGILYIRKQLLDVLLERGVSEISAQVGDRFDPLLHEAIGTVIDNEKAEDTIVEVKNLGYKLHERVIRPVHVIVATQEGK